jgi:hypothetical protein
MTKKTKDWGPSRLGVVRRVCSKYSHPHRKFSCLNADHTQLIKRKKKLVRNLLLMHLIYKRKSRRLVLDPINLAKYQRLARIFLRVAHVSQISISNLYYPCVPLPLSIDKDGRAIT